MGNFSIHTKGRAWIATFQISNMEKAGLSKEQYEDPEFLAVFISKTWEESGKSRLAGVAVCISAEGLYHAHVALYGNLTTLGNVAKIMYSSHVEPQLGGKKELLGYLLKEPPYNDSGEHVLFTKGLEHVRDNKGNRSDLDEIAELLEQGLTPTEVMAENFAYRKYEKMIKSAYIDKRIKDTPLIKTTRNEWHVGDSGTGKSFYFYQLCEIHSPEKIYFATDFETGGFDFYIEQGAPPILFLDEFKGNMRYSQLLNILDKYSRSQTHCRYTNTYNLWTTCIITSIFPPDEVYSSMVDDDKKSRDKIDQLLRRLDVIVFHYKLNGDYKTYSIPAIEYKSYEDLKRQALQDENGWIALTDTEYCPFDC